MEDNKNRAVWCPSGSDALHPPWFCLPLPPSQREWGAHLGSPQNGIYQSEGEREREGGRERLLLYAVLQHTKSNPRKKWRENVGENAEKGRDTVMGQRRGFYWA